MVYQFVDGLILLCTMAALWIGHKHEWHLSRDLTNKDGRLKRLPSYAYGVGCIIAGFAAFCVVHPGGWIWLMRLSLASLAAGMGTIAPRIFEAMAECRATKDDRDDAMRHIENG